MAFAVSQVTQTIFGNKVVRVMRVTPDAAEGTIATGLKVIDWVQISGQSMTTSGGRFFNNVGSTSTAALGTIGASACTSGDTFFVIAYGH